MDNPALQLPFVVMSVCKEEKNGENLDPSDPSPPTIAADLMRLLTPNIAENGEKDDDHQERDLSPPEDEGIYDGITDLPLYGRENINRDPNVPGRIHVSLLRRNIECVGPTFMKFWVGSHGSVKPEIPKVTENIVNAPSADFEEDPEDIRYIRALDPKDWKAQDHYAVLGLGKLRHKATEEDIKKAYRLKVLRHHPDKRLHKAPEEKLDDDDYFSCITKAYEILGNPQNRRSFDSVDPCFDNEIPPVNEHSRNYFFEVFSPVFKLNSRWSEITPIPQLGNDSTPRLDVERFYQFWYNFQSWREFSYNDDEDRDTAHGREERKMLEKINKASRIRRKKEEMARIRSLVDNAYNLDPRIQRFKQEDKDKKLAAKEAKKQAARARQEEEERKAQAAMEEKKKQQEKAEAEQKTKQEALKAERESLKRALKKERASLRRIAKENNYYAEDPSVMVKNMANLEKICECLSLEELTDLVPKLSKEGRPAFLRAMEETERRMEHERQKLMESASKPSTSGSASKSKKGSVPWSHEQLQLLIKAVKLFPAGTNQRWEVVAQFINQHIGPGDFAQRTAKEVLAQAKELQSSDYSLLKAAANRSAYDQFEKEQKQCQEITAETTKRYDEPADQQDGKPAWTAMEQQLLEQALKTYPVSTPERWDRIAECLPTRTKKDCMRRYKELAYMVKAKKAAQAAVTTNNQKIK